MTEPVKHLNTIVRTHISQNDRVHIPPDSMSINRLRFTALPTNAEKKKVNVQKSKHCQWSMQGRASDIPPGKNVTTSLFDVPLPVPPLFIMRASEKETEIWF